ncbi:hypothetical protein CF392_10605 [Tamilnaduibacter salinus]|uniref:L,D-TPase catalytic domain-containing protein n=1 Tax=Tamilnaduibacter salinus TaxID=1484056 RepID=A0A2A2I352_9GAMM|nr:L,D-transpeptidase family protein [Tamilnaduibacter salinus]PAV25530.1 hypothetical protein CF392_10605 [Tamilnaduibacter salinus]
MFRTLCLLIATLLAWPAAADELAMANTRYESVPESTKTGTSPPVSEVVVRKGDRELLLMSGEKVLRRYRISLGDRPEGHKLWEGDERTPEGRYTLDWRNPNSDYYKSIHISYPNAEDLELARAWGLDPGGEIMIHGLPNEADDMAFAYEGLDWTDGCIAVSNQAMDEIWSLVSDGTEIRILP